MNRAQFSSLISKGGKKMDHGKKKKAMKKKPMANGKKKKTMKKKKGYGK